VGVNSRTDLAQPSSIPQGKLVASVEWPHHLLREKNMVQQGSQ